MRFAPLDASREKSRCCGSGRGRFAANFVWPGIACRGTILMCRFCRVHMGSPRVLEVRRAMRESKVVWLVVGLVMGLVVGLNVAGIWPQVPLHAVATHGQESFAICTAPLDQDVEAV